MAPPLLRSIDVGDAPEAWAGAGFAVERDVLRLGDVAIHLRGRDGGRGIRSWAFDGIDAAAGAIDGLTLTTPTEATESDATGLLPHPNHVVGIDHVVLASPDVARTTAAFEDRGFEVRRVRDTDTYGAPMRQVFFRSGSTILELVGPHDAGDGPAGFFGLALVVDDLDAAADLLGEALGAAKDAVQPGRRIATVRHKALHLSVALALMSPEPGK